MHLRREVVLLLNAEAEARDIDVIRGQQVDGIVLASLLECRFDAEDFAHSRDLLRGRDATDRGDAAANEIDHALGNQGLILRRVGEDFADGLRSSGRLAHFPIPGEVLRRQHILHEIEVIRLHSLGEGSAVAPLRWEWTSWSSLGSNPSFDRTYSNIGGMFWTYMSSSNA